MKRISNVSRTGRDQKTKVFLTIPVSTNMCKRSFSAIRRLETYVRFILTAKPLN